MAFPVRTRVLLIGLLGTALLGGLVQISRVAIGAGDGLAGHYYRSPDRSGAPVFAATDGVPSDARFAQRWAGSPPEAFGAAWEGYLVVGSRGTYRFETTSDDGSWLYIDGTLVVDNGGAHSPVTRSGVAELGKGAHRVRVEYAQLGGEYAFSWGWGQEDTPPQPVPLWALSTRRVSYGRAVAARVLDILRTALVLLFVAQIGWGLVIHRRAVAHGTRPIAHAIVGRYESRSAFGISVVAYAALLCLPWGPWGLLDTLRGTAQQLASASRESLTRLPVFQSNLHTPQAGQKQVLPARVLTMVELLDRHQIDRYALSPRISDNNWVHQQMVASAWPRRLETNAPDRFFLSDETLPASCQVIEFRDEVVLGRCP